MGGGRINTSEQRLHLLAIVLVAVAIAFVITPAAYHRQTGPQEVSELFITLSTRFLLWSKVPLALAICLELYLINRLILKGALAALLAAGVLALFVILWFVLPRVRALQYL